jgi:glutamate-ammonia-ligase adenylyltransferase
MEIETLIKEASFETPDPVRALKNLKGLLSATPDLLVEHQKEIKKIAKLFSYSQFLADYSIKNPKPLFEALQNLNIPVSKQIILSEVYGKHEVFTKAPFYVLRHEAIELLRRIKKSFLLRITLKDTCGLTSLTECMAELSILSEAIIELALILSTVFMKEKFGDLKNDTFSIIGLGKLGAGELNYSSDIDIISVYSSGEHLSSGVLTPSGVRVNRIDSHEYFCRLTETLTGLLSAPTEDGFAYRVDLRLRPNGQKGELSLPLDSYSSYYESWGRTWERVALIRARPVAGDNRLGEKFQQVIEPFVWKRSTDYNDIEEIKNLKRKIDTIADVNDVKRGYGGIREIEFFVHAFQLLYGGERGKLRLGTLNIILQELSNEGFLSGEDSGILSESYLFLRRLEHILQMKDDLQLYCLPSSPDELHILSKKMHFHNEKEFSSELKLRRLKVRDMYASLLGGPEAQYEVMAFVEGELTDNSTMDYLSFKGFKNLGSALKNVRALHEYMSLGKTLRERTLLRKTIPFFFDQILKSKQKDRALSMLVTFFDKIGTHESYIDLLLQRKDTREILITTFSTSTYFTRVLLSLENLEGIFEYPDIRMDFKSMQERLINVLTYASEPMNIIRDFKNIEELKSCFLFMKGIINVYRFSSLLSMLADTIIRVLLKHLHAEMKFAVIGLGGFGARELNIGSDLDLIFVSPQGEDLLAEGPCFSRRTAEELIRFFSEYTAKGIAYRVDMRLRPDGSRGILVNDIDGYKNYYLKSAQLWEIQSLLRARPIAGDKNLLKAFYSLRRQVIMQRGKEISGSDVKDMRKRIIQEISKESSGAYDLKHGPGGIKEIEFLVQYIQLKLGGRIPELITQDTVTAIKRSVTYGILDRNTEERLLHAHWFMRTVDTILRLNEEDALKFDSELIDIILTFLDLSSKDDFVKQIEDIRQMTVETAIKVYGQEFNHSSYIPK